MVEQGLAGRNSAVETTRKGTAMKEIDKRRPVMVTGVTGYMASWIVKMLLEDGVNVNATVRDPSNGQKVEHLTRVASTSAGKLKLFKADLLDVGSFDEPMQGCELVVHTASPFFMATPKNPEEELLRPAKEGTRCVLEAAKRTPTVKRVVLTSSVAAICGDLADLELVPGKVFTEKQWNVTSSAEHLPYAYSKTIAEKEAWATAAEQDQWDLLTINPGWILGPSVSKRNDSFSINAMIQFGDGTYKNGAPDIGAHPVADVRDVASAHIKAGFTPKASGRHIVSRGRRPCLSCEYSEKTFWRCVSVPPETGLEVPDAEVWLYAKIREQKFGPSRQVRQLVQQGRPGDVVYTHRANSDRTFSTDS